MAFNHDQEFIEMTNAQRFAEHMQSVHGDRDAIIVRDSIYDTQVDRGSALHMFKYEGKKFYFCSNKCLDKFAAAPAIFLAGRPEPEPMPEGKLCSSVMHQAIEQVGPGDAHAKAS